MNFSGNELRIKEVLHALNYEDISQLFDQIPSELRYPDIAMPDGLDEISLRKHIEALAEKNPQPVTSFRGAGFYHHYIPSVVDYIASLGSFSTTYTPYQAEVSQGTLQMLFEYQSYLAEITAMDLVNASHYDGATAFAEALRMLFEANKKRGNRICILSRLNPEYTEIIQTYMKFTGANIEYADVLSDSTDVLSDSTDVLSDSTVEIPDDCCVLSVALPDYYGRVADVSDIAARCREAGVLFHVHADPLLCSVTVPPGELGADVYTGEGQVLGIPVNMGGPYLGIFAARSDFQRKIPGRIVGETCDLQGRRGFVLALSTREQHIRREKASSNICTNQGLMALRASVYMAAMGRDGLQTVANRCISNVHYLMEKLSEVQGFSVDHSDVLHFREFVLRSEFPVKNLLIAGEKRGIASGVLLDNNTVLVSSTEIHTPEDLDGYIELCMEVAKNERE